jgi:hypothetical protein
MSSIMASLELNRWALKGDAKSIIVMVDNEMEGLTLQLVSTLYMSEGNQLRQSQ